MPQRPLWMPGRMGDLCPWNRGSSDLGLQPCVPCWAPPPCLTPAPPPHPHPASLLTQPSCPAHVISVSYSVTRHLFRLAVQIHSHRDTVTPMHKQSGRDTPQVACSGLVGSSVLLSWREPFHHTGGAVWGTGSLAFPHSFQAVRRTCVSAERASRQNHSR